MNKFSIGTETEQNQDTSQNRNTLLGKPDTRIYQSNAAYSASPIHSIQERNPLRAMGDFHQSGTDGRARSTVWPISYHFAMVSPIDLIIDYVCAYANIPPLMFN